MNYINKDNKRVSWVTLRNQIVFAQIIPYSGISKTKQGLNQNFPTYRFEIFQTDKELKILSFFLFLYHLIR